MMRDRHRFSSFRVFYSLLKESILCDRITLKILKE